MPRPFLGTVAFLFLFLPLPAGGGDTWEQEFVVTGYYSPLPNQCCYIRGSLEADRLLNGEGRHAADGTAVYAGMAAAPEQYPFGSAIHLSGFGTVTVHDRGSAITALPDGSHRLDLWMGEGEEGLARALAFGVQRIRGTVSFTSPSPVARLPLTAFSTPLHILAPYRVPDASFLALHARHGDRSYSVLLLQERLQRLGYFTDSMTGAFGPATEHALQRFLRDAGSAEPRDALTAQSAALLLAAGHVREMPRVAFVTPESDRTSVRAAQRLLRALGYYRGRTHGIYDRRLFRAILTFQRARGIVTAASDRGAGTVGPQTSAALARARWQRSLARRAETFLLRHAVGAELEKRGRILTRFLYEGERGESVRLLQQLLARHGFFPPEKVNGVFGPLTKAAVLQYQSARGIITSAAHPAAGYVGPATLRSLREQERREAYHLVRAEGWTSL